MEDIYNKLVSGIKYFFRINNFKKAVIGLSGGIDSAVSAKLVSDAIGPENLHALIMPVKGLSSKENIEHSIEFCKMNNIQFDKLFINGISDQFKNLEWKQNKTAKMNTYSRIRAVVLYNYANSHNAIVIGTSNKTEILIGYFTKYGDGAVDIEVIGDLYKTDVKELSKYLKIIENIINKTPTAELYPGQTDEDEIGIKYEELDKILKFYIDNNLSSEKIIEEGFDRDIVLKIVSMIKMNIHKRELPPVVKVKE